MACTSSCAPGKAEVTVPAMDAIPDKDVETGPEAPESRLTAVVPDTGSSLAEDESRPAVPPDAGEHAEGLEKILRRIPEGWGRWISCGAGWYPILVRLDRQIAELLPDYEIHQVKEKYGAIRFYWSVPDALPACCASRESNDPRPHPGPVSGKSVPESRTKKEQRELEEWLARSEEHLRSVEHAEKQKQMDESGAQELRSVVEDKVQAIVNDAERLSGRTCERCGREGNIRNLKGWLKTLCDGCYAETERTS